MTSGAPTRSHRLAAWALVGVVLAAWVVAGLVRPGWPPSGTAPLTATPSTQVVLVGVPGLEADLIDPVRTPTLARLAQDGASGALVLRGAYEVTCAADAWLTLGAGQRAGTDRPGCGDAVDGTTGRDPDLVQTLGGQPVAATTPGPVAAQVQPEAWAAWRTRAESRPLGAELGSLTALLATGSSPTCVAAYGAEAGLAAADPQGRLASYTPGGLGDPSGAAGGAPSVPTLDPRCRVHLISGPAVAESDRTDALPRIDTDIARLERSLPGGTALIVAGWGHTAGRATAQLVLVRPGTSGVPTPALLTSASTRQPGLVQLTDLSATLAGLAGQDTAALAGRPVELSPDQASFGTVRDLADGAGAAKRLAPWVLGLCTAVIVPVLLLGLALRRGAVVAGAATLAMGVPAATFLAGLVPWWRAGQPAFALAGLVLGIAALLAVIAWAGPWRHHPLGPAAVVAVSTLVTVGADVLTGGRLGLISVLGVQPVVAGRFYGMGNVGLGIVLGALVVALGAVVSLLPRGRAAALAVLALGGGAVVLDAAPFAGADFGGVVPLVVLTGLMALWAAGLRWSARTLGGVALMGLLVAGAAMVLDWTRGPGSRTHLGDFVQAVIDGQAMGIVGRKLGQSIGILVRYPLSWLAVLALVLVALAVARRVGWLAPVWAHPALRPTAIAALAALVAAWAMNDSGVAIIPMTLAFLIGSACTLLGTAWRSPGARGSAATRGA